MTTVELTVRGETREMELVHTPDGTNMVLSDDLYDVLVYEDRVAVSCPEQGVRFETDDYEVSC